MNFEKKSKPEADFSSVESKQDKLLMKNLQRNEGQLEGGLRSERAKKMFKAMAGITAGAMLMIMAGGAMENAQAGGSIPGQFDSVKNANSGYVLENLDAQGLVDLDIEEGGKLHHAPKTNIEKDGKTRPYDGTQIEKDGKTRPINSNYTEDGKYRTYSGTYVGSGPEININK